jgi:hypothetical protein
MHTALVACTLAVLCVLSASICLHLRFRSNCCFNRRESYIETMDDQSNGRNRLTTDFFCLVTNEEAKGRKYTDIIALSTHDFRLQRSVLLLCSVRIVMVVLAWLTHTTVERTSRACGGDAACQL